jgi:CTP synthase (UTP-ammonia lyase)
MSDRLKIAVIGDFNFTYNSHHATNLALEHSQNLLELEMNVYWLRVHEAATFKAAQFQDFDALLVAPGPYENVFFLSGVIDAIIQLDIPVLITGDAFKTFVEVLIAQNNINGYSEKLISDNLASADNFEKVEIYPVSSMLKRMYNDMSRIELTSARYSLYPQLLNYLENEIIDVEAQNQFEDAEIISLKNHPFCVASMSLPQICSTREMPHPLISSFVNLAAQLNSKNSQRAV